MFNWLIKIADKKLDNLEVEKLSTEQLMMHLTFLDKKIRAITDIAYADVTKIGTPQAPLVKHPELNAKLEKYEAQRKPIKEEIYARYEAKEKDENFAKDVGQFAKDLGQAVATVSRLKKCDPKVAQELVVRNIEKAKERLIAKGLPEEQAHKKSCELVFRKINELSLDHIKPNKAN